MSVAPVNDHYAAIPDVAVVAGTLVALLMCELLHKHVVGPSFRRYGKLPYRDRFDWDRRALNLFFQLLQTPFNVYILLFDPPVRADPLYGYSPVAHAGFLAVIAFYIYDAIGIAMHPAAPSMSSAWLVHHAVAVGLLTYDVCFRRISAFPAATFMVSAAGHIVHEGRWILLASGERRSLLFSAMDVLCFVTVFLTCVLPPPYMLWRIAEQLQMPVVRLFTERMRLYCIFFFMLIYIPHCMLLVVQARRTYDAWGVPPKRFKTAKVS